MNCKVSGADLQQAVRTVAKALKRNCPAAWMEGILLEAKDQRMYLSATNGNLSIETSLYCNVTQPGKMLVDGQRLNSLCSLLRGEVSITRSAERNLQLKAGGRTLRICAFEFQEFMLPSMDEESTAFFVPANAFGNAAGNVLHAVGREQTRPSLGCVEVRVQKGIALCTAMDGYRLAQHKTKVAGDGDCTLLVPAEGMSVVCDFLRGKEEEAKTLYDGKKWQVQAGDTKVTVVCYAGDYIDWSRIVPKNFASHLTFDAENLLPLLEAALKCDKESRTVRIHGEKDLCQVWTQGGTAEVSGEFDCWLQGEDYNCAFNPRYLLEAVKAQGADKIVLKGGNAVQPCVVHDVDNEEAFELVLPVRVTS